MMSAEDLYMDRPDLRTPEETEDDHYGRRDNDLPDVLQHYIRSFAGDGTPEAEYRKDFEARKPALGLTEEDLVELESHWELPGLEPVQKRRYFRMLRNKVLRMLIPCSGCADVPALVAVLRAELESGVPAAVPDWYTFSTVTMGPRKIGYDVCNNRGCFECEDLERKFSRCGGCKLPFYCSRKCQRADWKARHKHVCKNAAADAGGMADVSKMMQMLSDMSLSGGVGGAGLGASGLASGLARASNNPGVAARRAALKKEKERGGRKGKKKKAKARAKAAAAGAAAEDHDDENDNE